MDAAAQMEYRLYFRAFCVMEAKRNRKQCVKWDMLSIVNEIDSDAADAPEAFKRN